VKGFAMISEQLTVVKIDFVGMRTNRFDETVALFRDVLGIPPTRQTDCVVGFRLRDETIVELYGQTDEFHSFFTTGPVVAFQVEDFDRTRQAMLKAGITFIGNVQSADRKAWQHFYAPDGTVLEISGPSTAMGS
jgi:catechol 2,3-dioxygenase-like lactoylglutathione lyase family enzyme